MAVASASSTSNAAWRHVCGGWASKSVFNIQLQRSDAFCSELALCLTTLTVVGKQNQQTLLIVMDYLHGPRVPREPGMLKACSNVVTRFVKDSCNFNKIGIGVNACESEEFHITMWG